MNMQKINQLTDNRVERPGDAGASPLLSAGKSLSGVDYRKSAVELTRKN